MSKYAEKIAALLAKAESSTHEAEAETYRTKAQELMVRWGVEDAELQAAGKQKTEPVIEKLVNMRGQYHRGLYEMGSSAAMGLGNIRTFISRRDSNNWTQLYLVGHESDVARAVTLINSLVIQSDAAMREWWKVERKENGWRYDDNTAWTARRQFFISFGYGVYHVLRKQRENAVESGSGTDLVLASRGQRVDSYVDSSMDIGPARGRGLDRGSYSAQQHGFSAGQRAANSTHQTSIGD